MKKIATILSALFITTIALTSCEPDETCKNCHWEKTDASGNIVNQGSAEEYCGDDLTSKENELPVTVGDYTTKWVCE